MAFQAGEPTVRILSCYTLLVTVALAAIIGLLAAFFWILLLWLLLPVIGGGLFCLLWYPRRFVATFRGSFDGRAVRATIGVVWKREIFVPMNALRTFESVAPPLHRLLHCRTLFLRFAGGATLLPLLPEDQAAALIDRLYEVEKS